jgi:hypothetical protein
MRLATACVVFPLTALACSSGSAMPDPGPGVDSSKKLNELSMGDLQALCDWSARLQGGYGVHIPCDAAPTDLEVPPDQATCVAEVSPHFGRASCTTTVGDWEACLKWRLSNWCSVAPPPATGQCAALQVGCYGPVPPDAGTD